MLLEKKTCQRIIEASRGKWSNLAQPNADNKKIQTKFFIVTVFFILKKLPVF